MSPRATTILAALLLAATALPSQNAAAQSNARWTRATEDSGCAYGTRRRADGACHGPRSVPVELQVEGARESEVWMALVTGALQVGFTTVPASDSTTANTRALGWLRVVKQPRQITITVAVRDPRISGRCREPQVVASTGMVSDVMLGALVSAGAQALMRCFDEQWSVAQLARSR